MPVRESTGRPDPDLCSRSVAVVVVLVLVFNLFFGGDDGSGEVTPSDGGAQVSGEEATATMCGHVQQVQVFRDDALGAAAEQLQQDAAALKQAGERQTARQVKAVIAAIDDARAALANQEDTDEPFAALQEAIARPSLLRAAPSVVSTLARRVLRIMGAMARARASRAGPPQVARCSAPWSSSTSARASR